MTELNFYYPFAMFAQNVNPIFIEAIWGNKKNDDGTLAAELHKAQWEDYLEIFKDNTVLTFLYFYMHSETNDQRLMDQFITRKYDTQIEKELEEREENEIATEITELNYYYPMSMFIHNVDHNFIEEVWGNDQWYQGKHLSTHLINKWEYYFLQKSRENNKQTFVQFYVKLNSHWRRQLDRHIAALYTEKIASAHGRVVR